MKKKITAVALVVALLAVGIIGGTLAYFTDDETAVNTFTSGNVAITLTEPNWDEDNAKLIPGREIAKNPTITVDTGSEDCWLVATVTVSSKSQLEAIYANETITATSVKQPWGLSLAGNGKMVQGGVAGYTAVAATDNGVAGTMLKSGDTEVAFVTYAADADANTITYTYWFKQAHAAGNSEVLFDKVVVPTVLKNGQLPNGLTVTVKAYAIQKEGFANVYAAYNAAF